jgi:hypothetical protein
MRRLRYGCETLLDSKIHNRSPFARLFSWFTDSCKFRFCFRFDVHRGFNSENYIRQPAANVDFILE